MCGRYAGRNFFTSLFLNKKRIISANFLLKRVRPNRTENRKEMLTQTVLTMVKWGGEIKFRHKTPFIEKAKPLS